MYNGFIFRSSPFLLLPLVLMWPTEQQIGEVTIGTPVLEDASVRAEITDQPRGKKVIHFRYKNKTRQRTKRGHRQFRPDLLGQGISSGE